MADQPDEKNKIDLDKILLPKKETPGRTKDSAQRVTAGALLQQEQTAAEESLSPTSGGKGNVSESNSSAAGSSTPKKEESVVQPLQTFQSDIEKIVQEKNVSLVSIAVSEQKRAEEGRARGEYFEIKKIPWARIGMWTGGTLVLLSAAALVTYALLRPAPTTPIEQAQPAPFLAVDDTKVVPLDANILPQNAITELNIARSQYDLSLGLVGRLLVGVSSTTVNGDEVLPITAQSLLGLISPSIPKDLLRTIEPTYVLGIHSYDENQPFLIFQIDVYERAYAGMLAWEPFMKRDLFPFFRRKPSPHIETTTASSTASSTPPVIASDFVDKVIENHDARVLYNDDGDIILLWTFLNNNTIILTTNDATVREVISRFTGTLQ